jgi:hypothetical protein
VGADPEHGRAGGLEPVDPLFDRDHLVRADRRERRRKEGEDDGAVPEVLGELERLVLARAERRGDVWRGVAGGNHGPEVRSRGKIVVGGSRSGRRPGVADGRIGAEPVPSA